MKTLTEVIDELFIYYVRSEEYVSLSAEGRNKFVDLVEELKQIASEK
jgi:hypothetical protein